MLSGGINLDKILKRLKLYVQKVRVVDDTFNGRKTNAVGGYLADADLVICVACVSQSLYICGYKMRVVRRIDNKCPKKRAQTGKDLTNKPGLTDEKSYGGVSYLFNFGFCSCFF